jgi:hypothetical protein
MHITRITSGDFVRIRMSPRQPLIYKHVCAGTYELVVGDKEKRDRIWSSGVLTGGVIDNDPESGVLRIGVVNQQGPDKIVRATIPYSSIKMLQLGVVEIQEVSVPEYLKGKPLKPRIKYERVQF